MDKKMRTQTIAILSRSFATASEEPLRYLQRKGYECRLVRNNRPEDTVWIAEKIGDADAVIIGNDVIDRYVLEHCPNLKAISKHGTGLDCIDVKLATEMGIAVTNALDANSESVADFAIMLMLTVIRNLKGNILTEPSPDWKAKELSHDLFGKTVGLLGYGKIGHGVARRLSGFNVRILVCDPYVASDDITLPEVALVPFSELLAESDILSLHLPLTNDTEMLFSTDTFAKMKDGAILINTARGGLIDMQALRNALESGKLRGAGLDVFDHEPPINEPALCMRNVVATPHIAPHTVEANYRMGMAAAKNADMLLQKHANG